MKLPLVLLCFCATLLAPGFSLALEPSPLPLEQVPAALEQMNKDLVENLEKARKAVDAEVAAGRLSAPAAQLLRWNLQTAISATGKVQLRTLLSSSRLPTENAAIMAVLTTLETANAQDQTRRAAILGDVTRDINARVLALLKTATKPAECESFERAAEGVLDALQAESSASPQGSAITSAVFVVQRLRRLLSVEAAGRPEEIAAALLNLRSQSNPQNLSVAVEERAERASQPLLDAITSAQDRLDEAILTRKPESAVSDALDRFADACDGYTPFESYGLRTPGRDPRPALQFYRQLLQLLARGAPAGAPGLDQQFEEISSSTRALDRPRAAKFRAFLAKLDEQATERAEKESRDRWSKLQGRLAAVTKPAELEAIAAELVAWSREPRERTRSEGAENWWQLSVDLAALAVAWVAPGGGFTNADRYPESPFRDPTFAATLRTLRQRIERDVLSRHLRAPELNAPPLVSLEIDPALDALADELAAKGEWRRLLSLLESRVNLLAARGRGAPDDAITALRAFFAAQNLESAEQWADAAQTYKEVLRSSIPRAPTAAAAEKLKALTKAHPEVQGSPATEPRHIPGVPGLPIGR